MQPEMDLPGLSEILPRRSCSAGFHDEAQADLGVLLLRKEKRGQVQTSPCASGLKQKKAQTFLSCK
jgi:hypothetical protein